MDFSSQAPKALEQSLDQHAIGTRIYAAPCDLIRLIRCRKGGPLAVTDANLLLGRLIPDLFPKIFGKSEKEPLDIEASKTAFEKVAQEVRKSSNNDYTLDEIVYG